MAHTVVEKRAVVQVRKSAPPQAARQSRGCMTLLRARAPVHARGAGTPCSWCCTRWASRAARCRSTTPACPTCARAACTAWRCPTRSTSASTTTAPARRAGLVVQCFHRWMHAAVLVCAQSAAFVSCDMPCRKARRLSVMPQRTESRRSARVRLAGCFVRGPADLRRVPVPVLDQATAEAPAQRQAVMTLRVPFFWASLSFVAAVRGEG